ncbi:hypothetical protein [Escherichia coli]
MMTPDKAFTPHPAMVSIDIHLVGKFEWFGLSEPIGKFPMTGK